MDIGSGATILVNVELEGVEQGRAALTSFGNAGEASANRVSQAISALTAVLTEQVRVTNTANAAERAMADARRESTRAARESREAKAAELKIGQQMADEIARERSLLLMHAAALEENTRREIANANAARAMASAHAEALEMEKARAASSSLTGQIGALGIGAGAFTGIAAVAAVTAGIHKLIDETRESQSAFAQLEAAVKSTGGSAGFSATQLADMASELQRTSAYSDEAVERAQAMLLTFDKIRGETFPGATKAVIDLSRRMGGDLQGAAVQVGKALQDPTQGLTALTRSGVSFSDAQKEIIKDLYNTGHEAQGAAIILRELQKEFGGSATAYRSTLGGALDNLKNQFGELFEASNKSTGAIVTGIDAVADALSKVPDVAGRAATAIAQMIVSGSPFEAFVKGGASAFQQPKTGPVTFQTIGQPLPGPPKAETIEEGQARIALLAKEREIYVALRDQYIAAREPLLNLLRAQQGQTAEAAHARETYNQQGYALDYLNIMFESAAKQAKIWTDFDGKARETALKTEIAHRNSAIAVLNLKTAYEDAAAATKFFGEAQGQLGAIAARNKAVTDAQTKETADRIKAAEKYSDDVGHILRGGLEKILTDGTKSWHDFFEDVLRMFESLMDRMAQRAKELNQLPGTGYKALGLASAGLIGGIAGYGVGQEIGNSAGGAFGGAAAGALAGSAFGPWGAVIGGLTGAAGGLLGGAKAHQEAAARLKEAADAFRGQASSYVAGAQGNPTLSALTGNQLQYDALAKALRALGESGAIGTREYNTQAESLYSAKQANDARIMSDFLDSVTKGFNDTLGPAGAYANALAQIHKQYDEAKAGAEALGVWEKTRATIEATLTAQQDALRKAEENRVAQINSDLAIRAAVAGGQDKYADELRVRAQQEQELFAAEQAHWTDEQIARLKNVQALEDQKRALDEATAAAERNANAQAGYQERFLRASGQDDALFAFQQEAERAKALLDLAKGVIDRTTFDWLVLAQGAEKAAREADKQAAAAQKIVDSQREALRVQQQAIDEQIRGAQEILNTTRQAIDGARKYLDSSKLGGLTPLGPEARYEEARRQYLTLGSAASGGDVKAFAQLPDAIEAFRKESQNMFASSSRYREDFTSSQIFLESLTGKFGVQATIQEQMLATLNAQKAVLDAQLARLQTAGIPKDITDGIAKVIPNPIDAGIDPVKRVPVVRDPGIDPPIRRIPVRNLDDLFHQQEVIISVLYNGNAKADSINNVLAHTHDVVSLQLPEQTSWLRATASNTAATTSAVSRLRQIGDGNGAI